MFVTRDTALIEKTCLTNQYPDLCVSTLKSDPTSINADTKGLAAIVINVAKDKYRYASDALQGSLQDLASDINNDASLQVSAAADYPNSCHNVFKGAPGLTYPSGLAQREELLVHLCGVAVGIINLLG
ncbi:hypothetical protein HHK36_009262 [Tetracentron sinense]|uniref:Pectinesterase inhibitor domain-containing protein n=1 Tax=Tetracentron sinense TaxID=13715 RepID=A0A834ZAK0_TETSI|nr:hypothetical protein HHK36_009262 [Tetracentron sinense]